MKYGVFCRPEVTIYSGMSETKVNEKGTVSAIDDQALYGMTCRILSQEEGWSRILTFYGYSGYVHSEDLLEWSEEEMDRYLSSHLRIVDAGLLDVMSLPTVSGICLLSVPGSSILEVLGEEETHPGWTRVRLLDGTEGYVTSCHLMEKRFGEEFLRTDTEETLEMLKEASRRSRDAQGGQDGFSLAEVLEKWYGGSEEAFRRELTAQAFRYRGVQYRWGGRSTLGVDCSGLVSISYLRSGVTIYRDAAIVNGFPMKKLDLIWTDGKFDGRNLDGDALQPGDALYFPGHIAMYLGEGKYIHSTARKGDNGVVINSLRPEDPEYRADLLELLYAAAGLR